MSRNIILNERKLPEGYHRIDMTVDLHTAMIVMLFTVSMIVSKIVPPLYLSLTPFFHTLKFSIWNIRTPYKVLHKNT